VHAFLAFDSRGRVRCEKLRGEDLTELVTDAPQRYAILGTPGAGEAWLDGAQIQFEHLGEPWLRRLIRPEEALLFRVALDELYVLFAPAGQAQIAQVFVVKRKERRGRA